MQSQVRVFLDRRFPNVSRVYRKLRDERYYGKLGGVRTNLGLILNADPRQVAALTEGNEVAALQALLKHADVFVDVGANVGCLSCVAAQMGKYVVAVEPHPLNLQCLCRNLKQNGLDREFEVHAAALGDNQRIASLHGGQQGALFWRDGLALGQTTKPPYM